MAAAVCACALVGCGADDEHRADAASADARSIDAPDLDAAVDAPVDAAIDATPRAAVLLPCDNATVALVRHRAEVTTPQMGYVPTGNATISVGQAVQWVNAGGGMGHTITSGRGGAMPMPDGLFDSGVFMTHGTFICVRFDAPGEYPYHCAVHPNSAEQAVITVLPQ